MLDRVVVGVGIFVKQLARHQNEARRAVAALKGAGFDESFLPGTKRVAIPHALNLARSGKVDIALEPLEDVMVRLDDGGDRLPVEGEIDAGHCSSSKGLPCLR